jgi:hypothetical protein
VGDRVSAHGSGMSPLGPLAVALCMGFFLALRWRGLHGTIAYSARTEAGYLAFACAAIAVSVVVTLAGRTAMLALTPVILIPAGVYLVNRSRAGVREFGIDLRRAGWVSIVTGVLGGFACVASLLVRG